MKFWDMSNIIRGDIYIFLLIILRNTYWYYLKVDEIRNGTLLKRKMKWINKHEKNDSTSYSFGAFVNTIIMQYK